MPFIETGFPGLRIFEPRIFADDRGYFYESYNENIHRSAGIYCQFVQDNQASSVFGVVRGLHFQKSPYAQTKLLSVLKGEILDVVVDLRRGSPTYSKVFSVVLNAIEKKQLLVPKGFAHGYSVLSETAEVFYKCDAFYNKEFEGGLAYNDPELAIDWKIPGDKALLSPKDLLYPSLSNCIHYFVFTAQDLIDV